MSTSDDITEVPAENWHLLGDTTRTQTLCTEASRLAEGRAQEDPVYSSNSMEHRDRSYLLSILSGTCGCNTAALTIHGAKVSPPGILGISKPWRFRLTLATSAEEDPFGFKSDLDGEWKEITAGMGFKVNAGLVRAAKWVRQKVDHLAQQGLVPVRDGTGEEAAWTLARANPGGT